MGKRMLLRRERSLLIHRSCGHERGASQNESQKNAGSAGSFHRGNFIMITAQQQWPLYHLKLPIGRESEFRDMNQFSGIGIVSLEFRVSLEVCVIA